MDLNHHILESLQLSPWRKRSTFLPILHYDDFLPICILHSDDFLPILHSEDFLTILHSDDFLPILHSDGIPPILHSDDFLPILCEEYVTSSVLGQGVFDPASLTLVIGTKMFWQI
jgi:hypothetical protein